MYLNESGSTNRNNRCNQIPLGAWRSWAVFDKGSFSGTGISLQWRHNERNGVSNHQPHMVYSSVCSGADHRKHRSSASLAFVRGIHRWPVNSPHKWPVTRKMFPFDDAIMLLPVPHDHFFKLLTIDTAFCSCSNVSTSYHIMLHIVFFFIIGNVNPSIIVTSIVANIMCYTCQGMPFD